MSRPRILVINPNSNHKVTQGLEDALKPLDFDTIHESVRKTGRCVIVHEAPRTAGFGAEIAARLAEHSMYDLLAPVERVTGYDTHIPLFRLEMKYLPSVDKIVAAAKRAMAAG